MDYPLFDVFISYARKDYDWAKWLYDGLSSRGLDVASPVIKQVVRTDLEGDGVNEILVVAEDVSPGFLFELGDYSILFMRKVVDGVVQTAVLEESVAVD